MRTIWTNELTDLNRLLAKLYPLKEEIIMIAVHSGLSLDNIAIGNKAIVSWYEVIKAACEKNGLDRLINRVKMDYPEDESLVKIASKLFEKKGDINLQKQKRISLDPEKTVEEESIKEALKIAEGIPTFVLSNSFPDLGILVKGKVGEYYPPFSVEVLFDDPEVGFALSAKNQLTYKFFPLILLGEELHITNYERKDGLGIRLKTAYEDYEKREKVYAVTAKVIQDIFYEVARVPKTESLIVEKYQVHKHPQEVDDLWPN